MIRSKGMKIAVTTAAATAIVCTGALAANVTATTSVNVRSGPGNSYSVLTVMAQGTSSQNLGNSGNWIKVSVNGKTGYVYSRYLSTDGSTSTSSGGTSSTNSSSTVYINVSALNVRSGPSTSYGVVGVMTQGSAATVTGTSGNWYKISYSGGTGYISKKYTSSYNPGSGSTSSGSSSSSSTSASTMYSKAAGLNVRSGAGSSYSSIGSLTYGQAVTVVDTSNYWYKVQYGGGYGYVGSAYLTSSKPSSITTTTPEQNPSYGSSSNSSSNSSSSSSSNGSSIVSYAKNFLGCSYVYGASGPNSFDCSGFTSYVYAHFGKSIPRSSSAQYSSCTKVSKSDLRAGDLVFFSNDSSGGSVGHVAIYMGDGMIIHAANSRTGVCTTSLSSSYYTNHYIGAGRY